MLSLIIRQSSKEFKSTISLLQKRSFMFKVKTNEKTYRRRDKIEESFSIIYKAPMEYILTACNHVTTISAIVLSAFAVMKSLDRGEISNERVEVDFFQGYVGMTQNDYIYIAIGLIVVCVGIRSIVNKYPLRIYRNQQNRYIAVFEGNLPFTKKKLEFERGSVKEMPVTGILPWRDYRYMIKDRSTIIYYEYFRTPSELINMMTKPKEVKEATKKEWKKT